MPKGVVSGEEDYVKAIVQQLDLHRCRKSEPTIDRSGESDVTASLECDRRENPRFPSLAPVRMYKTDGSDRAYDGTAPSDRGFLRIRDVAAVEILFATGMRVGQLVSLCTADWREGERMFLVKGKGSRQRLAVLPDNRSLKGNGYVLGFSEQDGTRP